MKSMIVLFILVIVFGYVFAQAVGMCSEALLLASLIVISISAYIIGWKIGRMTQ